MYTVIVGVDGSESGDAALRWAVEEARLRDGRLVVLLAYTYLDQRHLPGEDDFDPTYSAEEAERVLQGVVDRVSGDVGLEDVELRAVEEPAVSALLAAAEEADLLVVGSRGRGGFKGLLLGSVSQQVVTHASCPVVVHRGGRVA